MNKIFSTFNYDYHFHDNCDKMDELERRVNKREQNNSYNYVASFYWLLIPWKGRMFLKG